MTYTLHHGDCLDVMRRMEPNSVDTVVTDPPYGLSDHRTPDVVECLRAWLDEAEYMPDKGGFMGKRWDAWVPGPNVWREVLRVMKPGGIALVFAGTRSYDLMTLAMRLAGFEVRDCVNWLYGSGFPKSLDISKAIDKAAGEVREVISLNKNAERYPNGPGGVGFHGGVGEYTQTLRPPSPLTAPATDAARTWQGWGTSLKPAWEPVILAMKPIDGTFANNAQVWGVAGLNVDGCRIGITDGATMARNNKPGANGWKNSSGGPNSAALNGEPSGRWPANLVLDEAAARGEEWQRYFYVAKASRAERNAGLEGMDKKNNIKMMATANNTSGIAGKGFERFQTHPAENHHPTVKPLALMRYLVRLTSTPTGGVVLDPFCGSGTTGVACMMEGRSFVGIDMEAEYVEIARRRIEAAQPALLGEQ